MSNITRTRGDTYAEVVTVLDPDGGIQDITGYTFALTVDPNRNPTDATTNLFSIAGSVTDAANGIVEFPLTADDADQAAGDYWYDIQMTYPDLTIRTLVKARWKVIQDITK